MKKMSLEQLRETLPEVQTAPEDPSKGIEAAAAAAADQQARRERAGELRGCIMRQLQQGQPPQIVLYNALEAIGLYSGDTEWTERATRHLDSVYADLAQDSFMYDTATVAADRLTEKALEYDRKLRTRLNKAIRDYEALAEGFRGILSAMSEAENRERCNKAELWVEDAGFKDK